MRSGLCAKIVSHYAQQGRNSADQLAKTKVLQIKS